MSSDFISLPADLRVKKLTDGRTIINPAVNLDKIVAIKTKADLELFAIVFVFAPGSEGDTRWYFENENVRDAIYEVLLRNATTEVS